jgi:hypothetical protein
MKGSTGYELSVLVSEKETRASPVVSICIFQLAKRVAELPVAWPSLFRVPLQIWKPWVSA